MRISLDFWLIVPAALLSILGVTVLRSIAPDLVTNQILFFGLSVVVFTIFAFTEYSVFFSLYIPLYLSSIVFLLTPFFFGATSRGAVRWLQFGTYSLQPSEIIKPFLLIAYAMIITSSGSNKFIWMLLFIAVPALIIFKQPDLGTTLVLLVGWFTALLSRMPLKTLVITGILGLVMFYPVYRFVLHDYQRERLQTFVNPYRDPLGQGYHVIQSVIAVGSGRAWGRGLGHGTQSQLRFLPENHTDFIFASLSEELGFFGSLLILALFILLLWRIYHISQVVSDPAASLFCLSMASLLSFQIFVNIGMNIGLMPITGITLPFLSYGGSSILSLAITLGIINSISSHSRLPDSLQIH